MPLISNKEIEEIREKLGEKSSKFVKYPSFRLY